MRANKYVNNTAFLDLVFNLLLFISMLFVILLAILKLQTSKPAIEDKNEFIVQMMWNNQSGDDIDLWVIDPSQHVVGFKMKQHAGMHLQHDDLGRSNDTIVDSEGNVKVTPLNLEIVNIRKYREGRYTVNAHYYRRDQTTGGPVTVKIKLIKVNPFVEYPAAEITLQEPGSEETALTFDIDKNGNVTLLPPVRFAFVTNNMVFDHIAPDASGVAPGIPNSTRSVTP